VRIYLIIILFAVNIIASYGLSRFLKEDDPAIFLTQHFGIFLPISKDFHPSLGNIGLINTLAYSGKKIEEKGYISKEEAVKIYKSLDTASLLNTSYFDIYYASRLYYEEGKIDVAINVLKEQIRVIKDERLRNALKRRLESLIKVKAIYDAMKIFEQKFGRRPINIEELEKAKLIPPGLRDSRGGRFYITKEGKVRSEFELKITEDRGFTLIELLIAVVILSILAGFAMMQYNRYKISSYNTTAETDMRNLMTYEMSFLTGYETFVAFNVEDISEGGTVIKTISLPDGSTEEFKFIGFSPGVRGCVKVKDNTFANGGVKHNKGTKYIGYDFDTGIFLQQRHTGCGKENNFRMVWLERRVG